MYGTCLYYALASLLAILAVILHFPLFFFILIVYFFLLYRYKVFNQERMITLIGIATIFMISGAHAVAQNETKLPQSTTTFRLQFLQPPKIDGDLFQIEVKETTTKEKLLLRYRLPSQAEKEKLARGDFFQSVCTVSGRLEKPKRARNPNSFDYHKYLSGKKIYWIVETKTDPLQSCRQLTPTPLSMLKKIRFSGINYLATHFPPEIASLSAALLFGDRGMLEPELLGAYQSTGIVHLLAISGLHVSLLTGMIFFLGIRCGITREVMTNFLLLALPIYVVLAGASPSVIRAALMILLILLAVKWKAQLKLLAIDAVSIAFMVFLLVSPFTVFDVGFQLSFSVSTAIILASQAILKHYQGTVLKLLVTSIIAQLAALPFLLYHFYEMSIIGIFANMFYIPLFSFLYLPGLYILFIVHLLIGMTPSILIEFFLRIINASNHLILTLAEIPLVTFTPGRPALLEIILYSALIVRIFYVWEKPRKKLLSLIPVLLCLVTFQPIVNCLNPCGEVTVIDVGQGECIFIQLPFGKGNYLIDTGGTVTFSKEQWRIRSKPYEVGRDVVLPFLKSKGVQTIDKLILTHGDMDHIGGALAIIDSLHVNQLLLPSVADPSETEKGVIRQAKKNNIQVTRVTEGVKWECAGNLFYILGPEQNFSGERNSGSIAMYANVGGLSWFFGGDLDQTGEEKIIKKYPNLKVDVLKAGHHGSKTSTSEVFIKQVKPKIVLISAGEKNRFGHPHQEVLRRVEEEDARIYRTDLHGAITYQFLRGKGTFFTLLP
ncbi:DNA internalization-related competence protein ComEC/Rec2 [Bacillus rubiinfantis]|uniref:DNA internalization-related competence protein ComEC/Rec2 n=1 Tax=Bacillus rubiinfantis TaxID=1499680 RepID=UPI0005A7F13F|nr:DNA internalization-related competence protein ComEC/Rec2 [Bacillus rubiinfantis]